MSDCLDRLNELAEAYPTLKTGRYQPYKIQWFVLAETEYNTFWDFYGDLSKDALLPCRMREDDPPSTEETECKSLTKAIKGLIKLQRCFTTAIHKETRDMMLDGANENVLGRIHALKSTGLAFSQPPDHKNQQLQPIPFTIAVALRLGRPLPAPYQQMLDANVKLNYLIMTSMFICFPVKSCLPPLALILTTALHTLSKQPPIDSTSFHVWRLDTLRIQVTSETARQTLKYSSHIN